MIKFKFNHQHTEIGIYQDGPLQRVTGLIRIGTVDLSKTPTRITFEDGVTLEVPELCRVLNIAGIQDPVKVAGTAILGATDEAIRRQQIVLDNMQKVRLQKQKVGKATRPVRREPLRPREHLFSPHTDTCIYCGAGCSDELVAPTKCRAAKSVARKASAPVRRKQSTKRAR